MGNTTIIQESKDGQITTTIPKALAQAYGLVSGVKVEWVSDRGDLVVRKVR